MPDSDPTADERAKQEKQRKPSKRRMPNFKFPHHPLGPQQIKTALQSSGYPFEIRLAQAFAAAGMDPMFNQRFQPEDGQPTREVDLTARKHVIVKHSAHAADGPKLAEATLAALIEAKSMPRWQSFVGMSWRAPTENELRTRRVEYAGQPDYDWLSSDSTRNHVLFNPGGLGEALDPLNDAPVCVQWATVERSDKYPNGRADHDDVYAKALDTLVRIRRHRIRQITSIEYGRVMADWLPILYFDYPTLIVATPSLYIYDANTGEIAQTDRMILDRQFEAGGRVVSQLVDVVTESGVQALITRYEAAAQRLEAVLPQAASRIAELYVAEQKKRERGMLALAAANRTLGRGSGGTIP